MSCDNHRGIYFRQVAAQNPDLDQSVLERLFQVGRNQPVNSRAEQALAEMKTRLLFADMQKMGIKPPTHSPSGLPRKDAQAGYAKVYDHMKAYGYFDKVSQERQEEIERQTSVKMRLVGLSEDDNKEHTQRFPVWKYVPRCARCGRFMSTINPVCTNPRCALAGKKQHEPTDWPPAGANFKRTKARKADYAANDALPRAAIRVQINGVEKDVILEQVYLDGTIRYSETIQMANGVTLKGLGTTNKANVVAWEGQAQKKAAAIEEKTASRKPSVNDADVSASNQEDNQPGPGAIMVSSAQSENSAEGHCEHCGGFLDKDGICNNPHCPGAENPAENALDTSVETIEEPAGADATIPEDEVEITEALTTDFVEEQPRGHDYRISDADELGKGSAKAKARANIEAIKLVKKLEEENRLATPEEQAILVKFVGWGGLPQVFDSRSEWYDPNSPWAGKKPEFYDEYHELKQLLSEEEWNAASRSTVNAHYTSATVIRAMYAALKHMGFDRTDGNILEPASGIGHFFGLMPEEYKNARRVAVELDPITARIAKHLYQNADVRNAGFQETNLPNDYFDLAISNVPFGNFAVVDKDFLGARRFLTRAIHNFFFAKALDKVKPGGTIAFITSRYTLDSKDPSIRKYLSERAELVGAIRLPNTAFKENAGTEVTTDIIFLRKRLPGESAKDDSWVETGMIQSENGEEIRVNRYFVDHPEMMLGKMSMSGSMYSGREATLESDGRELGEALQDAIKRLPEGVLSAPKGRCSACGSFLDKDGNCNNPRCPRNRPLETRRILPEEGLTEGQYVARPEGVYRLENGELVPHEKNGQMTKDGQEALEVRRIRGLVALNQVARRVLKLNVEQAEDADLSAAQAELNQVYDDFVKTYGPVNSRANQRALSGDPNLPFLMALEKDYDAEKNTASKEAIFEKRVISVNKTVEKVDSAQDALRVALNESGMINWERMAELTGMTVSRLQKELTDAGLVFETPAGKWETAEEYLSGNVRVKLAEAEAAAALDRRFRRNVEALQAVKPRDLEAAEIKAPLGSPWIPPDDIAQFASELLRAKFKVTFISSIAEWKVIPESTNRWFVYEKNSTLATQTWGTKHKDALTLLEDALNGREPTVYKTVQDIDGKEKKIVDQEGTIAAREAQTKIKEQFEKWLFADEERSARLVRTYNELYNSEVPRRFDGSHLTLPGMGANMPELRPHQKDAIWRISQGKNTLLAHIVGAGKTFSMIGGSMELRRTGLRKKPMHVVPNHMLEQYTADFYRMYPAARILALSADDVSEKRRALTMSRIATGDWDAVIITHSALGKIPLKPESEAAYLEDEINDLREALEAARQEGEKITVKDLEKRLARQEAKLQEKLMQAREKQDKTITWEELGVDQLFVDEADLFKNLDFPTRRTRLAGVKGQASSRAQDLFVKIRTMRAKYGDNQSVVFATGTPIANSVSEMYNMQRFLDYDHLKDLGLAHFDNWASQFGDIVTSIEMKPSGGGYQTKSRFAQFNNVPELKRLFMRFADVQVDPDELNLRRPKLKEDENGNRRPRGIAVPASDELKAYIKSLVERAENLKNVDPKDDNMLKITSDGRKAALDMRLIDPLAEDNPNSKLNKAIENIFEIYKRTTGLEVPGMEGKQNMAQMVFCDLGTPNNNEGFNLYADIKRKLIARGVKPDEIAFMQDCKSDEDKFELFQRVNAGQVRILIGSTETMGAGTNAQRRLAALHHLDAPWRPRDVEQREGRILRQGNINEEVEIYRYLTEESFDVYNWQLLERKARFIAQVMNRDLTVRSVEDIDAKALTYAEMKALATGNPAVIEKVAVDAELRKLTALEAAWKQRNHDLQVKLNRLPQEIEETRERIRRVSASIEAIQRAYESEAQQEQNLKAEIETLRAWTKKIVEEASQEGAGADVIEQAKNAKIALQSKTERFKRNGAFTMRVRSTVLDDKDRAGDYLAILESDLLGQTNPGGEVIEVGEYLGFALLAQPPKMPGGEVRFFLKLTEEEAQLIPGNKETGRTFEADGKGSNVARLRRALGLPEKRLEADKNSLANLEREYATVKEAGGAFEHSERLKQLRERAAELDAILQSIGGDNSQVLAVEE
jgi:N12 class adenine-specific DNA methylase